MAEENVTQSEIQNLEDENKKGTTPINNTVYNTAVKVSSTSIGQFLVRRGDKFLWVIENTAKWSVPQNIAPHENNTSENQMPPVPLIRPLSWILFIPALILLRLVRAALSFALVLLGKETLTPENVVSYIQVKRRKLRAIKYQGMKIIRQRNQDNHEQNNDNKNFMKKFVDAINYLMCSSGNTIDPVKIIIKETQSSNNHNAENSSKKRHHDDENGVDISDSDDDQKMKCSELLDKYANEDSDDDPNFEPKEHETDSDTSIDDSETEDALSDDKTNHVTEKENDTSHEKHNGEQTETNENNKSYNEKLNGSPPGKNQEPSVNSPKQATEEKKMPHSTYHNGSSAEEIFYSPIASPTPEHNENSNNQNENSNTQNENHNHQNDNYNQNENNTNKKFFHPKYNTKPSKTFHNHNHHHNYMHPRLQQQGQYQQPQQKHQRHENVNNDQKHQLNLNKSHENKPEENKLQENQSVIDDGQKENQSNIKDSSNQNDQNQPNRPISNIKKKFNYKHSQRKFYGNKKNYKKNN